MRPLQGGPRRSPGEIKFKYETFNTYKVISAYASPKAEDRWYRWPLDVLLSQLKDISTHIICKFLDLGDAEEPGFKREALDLHGTFKTLT